MASKGPILYVMGLPAKYLVVDDNEDVHILLRRILSSRSAADTMVGPDVMVDSAYDGEQGVEKLKASLHDSQPYVLAFVDLVMPGKNGVDTASEMLKIDSTIQICFCSSYPVTEINVSGRFDAHADRLLFLRKPFELLEVRHLVGALRQKVALTRQAQGVRNDDSPHALVAQADRVVQDLIRRLKIIEEAIPDDPSASQFQRAKFDAEVAIEQTTLIRERLANIAKSLQVQKGK